MIPTDHTMKSLHYLIVTSTLIVAFVAVSSFIFSTISPDNRLIFMRTVDIVSTFVAIAMSIGGIGIILSDMLTHLVFAFRVRCIQVTVSQVLSGPFSVSLFRSWRSETEGIQVSNQSDLKAAATEGAATAEPAAPDAAKPAAPDAAEPAAAAHSGERADAPDAADSAKSECNSKEGEGSSTVCSSPDLQPQFEGKKGASPDDISDAISGASTVC